jgi:hypothetical protein
MTGKKAFVVRDNDSGTVVVFDKRAVSARRHGANELDIEFYAVESCRRAPEFDEYAGQGFVPARVLIEHGWRFECNGCCTWVDSDLEGYDEDDEPIRLHPVYENHGVWCSPECKAAYEEDRRVRKELQAAAIADFKRRVLKRFPGVTFEDGSFKEHAYAQHNSAGIYGMEQIVVNFDFPGRKIGAASYRYDLNLSEQWSLVGPRAPYFVCCNGDKEAFESFARGEPLND